MSQISRISRFRDSFFTKPHQGFIFIHPSDLPLACSFPRLVLPLGFLFMLPTPPLPATQDEPGIDLDTNQVIVPLSFHLLSLA